MEHLLKAIPEPSPAKTKMSMEKNSARAALIASDWPISAAFPKAILQIGIFFFKFSKKKKKKRFLFVVLAVLVLGFGVSYIYTHDCIIFGS